MELGQPNFTSEGQKMHHVVATVPAVRPGCRDELSKFIFSTQVIAPWLSRFGQVLYENYI